MQVKQLGIWRGIRRNVGCLGEAKLSEALKVCFGDAFVHGAMKFDVFCLFRLNLLFFALLMLICLKINYEC